MAVDPNIKILVADDSGTMRVMFKQIAIMEAGGNGHVPKPFDAQQIKAGILKAFAPETKKMTIPNTERWLTIRSS